MQEILKLLHELLPEVTSNQNEELMSSIEKSLHDQSFRLLKFGLDALPTLVQVGPFIRRHIYRRFFSLSVSMFL